MAGLWEKAKYWLDTLSSHGVGVKAVSEVCPRAGGLSRRRRDRIIVIVIVKQTIYSIYNIIVGRGDRRVRVSSR